MTRAYQHDELGCSMEEIEDYGFLPSNSTYTVPQQQVGYIPRWDGSTWEQIEDHKGKEGHVDGAPQTIKEYG